ncbi:MAG: hypothetical protein M3P43_01575 [Actinomycetota bacterium]|nr:hypothetical protein [Actinomycetota bacterium]
MLEVTRTLVGVVTASAAAGALDMLVVPGRAFARRTADDELVLLSAPQVTDEVAREVVTRLAVLDPDALVIDTTDGWTAITVAGVGARASFGLLSRLELPDAGFAQGEVVHIPAKVVADDGRVLVLAPSMWETHLHDRVTKALGVPVPFQTRSWAVPAR